MALSVGAAIVIVITRYRHSSVPSAEPSYLKVLDDTAIVFSTDHTRSWISRVSSAGIVLWWRPVDGTPTSGDPIRILGDIVAVRSQSGKARLMTAFKVTGDPLWQRQLALQDTAHDRSGPAYGVVGVNRLLEEVRSGTETRLQSIDPPTGVVGWTVPWGWYRTASVIGPRLIAYGLETPRGKALDGLDLRTGDSVSKSVRGVGCVIGQDYIAVSSTSLVRFTGGDLQSPSTIRENFDLRGTVSACGSYRDRIVMLVDDERMSRVVVVDQAGKELSIVELPRHLEFDQYELALRHGDLVPFGGELPRFVPFVQQSAEGGVTMVDLEAGAIAWQGKTHALDHATVFRDRGRWYLNTEQYLAMFDGSTGRLAAAIALLDGEPVGPEHVSDGVIWLIRQRVTMPVDEPPVTTIDSRTLAGIHGRRVFDVLPTIRELLGSP
ncbi:MAG: hypothetical protein ABI867_26925 [Kofleriaceae bacterium]